VRVCRVAAQAAFHARIAFCLDLHNEAVKAMRFDPDAHRWDGRGYGGAGDGWMRCAGCWLVLRAARAAGQARPGSRWPHRLARWRAGQCGRGRVRAGAMRSPAWLPVWTVGFSQEPWRCVSQAQDGERGEAAGAAGRGAGRDRGVPGGGGLLRGAGLGPCKASKALAEWAPEAGAVRRAGRASSCVR
jgi:hypothetical protein